MHGNARDERAANFIFTGSLDDALHAFDPVNIAVSGFSMTHSHNISLQLQICETDGWSIGISDDGHLSPFGQTKTTVAIPNNIQRHIPISLMIETMKSMYSPLKRGSVLEHTFIISECNLFFQKGRQQFDTGRDVA